MSRIFSDRLWYQEIDLGAKSEKELSDIFKSHVATLFPDLKAFEFEHTLRTIGGTTRADLCLINESKGCWYIIEVEKSSHNLYDHVLPQLRRFKESSYDDELLLRFISNNEARVTPEMKRVMLGKPPALLVVVDSNKKTDWRKPLMHEGISLIELRLFRNDDSNRFMIEIEGELPNQPTTLVSICRLKETGRNIAQLILTSPNAIPTELTKIPVVYNGVEGEWTVLRTSTETYIFKQRRGVSGFKFELHRDGNVYLLKDFYLK
jgi:hypothetical protein